MMKELVQAALPLVLMGLMLALMASRDNNRKGKNDALLCAALCMGALLSYFLGGFINWGVAMGLVLLIVSGRQEKETEHEQVSAAVELHSGEGNNTPDAHI